MAKHNARTTEQLLSAAEQGDQFPCGSIADHMMDDPRHQCAQCTERRARMTTAYYTGGNDARERAGLYDLATVEAERKHATQAYAQATTEPAVSYLVGYCGALHDAVIEHTRKQIAADIARHREGLWPADHIHA